MPGSATCSTDLPDLVVECHLDSSRRLQQYGRLNSLPHGWSSVGSQSPPHLYTSRGRRTQRARRLPPARIRSARRDCRGAVSGRTATADRNRAGGHDWAEPPDRTAGVPGTRYRGCHLPGPGTFAVPGDGRYLRSFGSIDDLMSLSLDTELQVVEPLHVLASVDIADQLRPGADTVMTMSFLRLHDGVPFCYTRVHVPMEIGRKLRELPEVAELAEPGARARFTLISLIERVCQHPIHSAAQDATAVAADPEVAHRLGCAAGLPVLRIDRLYRDRELTPLELAVNYFHPDRYSYRIQLRAQLDHSAR